MTQLEELAESCRKAVKKALNVELDGTVETLPLLDHYARSADVQSEEVLRLVAAYCGAYFSTVLMAHYRTTKLESPPEMEAWRLYISSGATGGLSFNPIGLAIEIILQDDANGWGAHFEVAQDAKTALARALDSAGPVSKEDYYRFSTRVEAIDHVLHVLATDKKAN